MNAVTKTSAQTPVTRADASSNMLSIIAQAAADPRVDVIKMTALLDLQEKLLNREAQSEFNRALARMNTDDLRVHKNGLVSLGPGKPSYKFAKWEDMDRVIRPLMQENGFTLSFDTTTTATGGLVVIGELLHEGGHSRTARIPLALDTGPGRNALQAMGSTVSYGKRYVTEMLLNIVREDEDDDGVGGAFTPPPTPPRYTPRTAPLNDAIPERVMAAPAPAQSVRDMVRERLAECESAADVIAVGELPQVKRAEAKAPPKVWEEIKDMMADRYAVFVNTPHDPDTGEVTEPEFPGDR